jgi:DNA-directed RNA polymerase subunit RPC12/RpoP
MAGWRKALLRTGRESDLYHCQLCKHRLWVKQRRLWAALLHYRGIYYKYIRLIAVRFILY